MASFGRRRSLTRFAVCLILWFLLCKCDFNWVFSVIDDFMIQPTEHSSENGIDDERNQQMIGKFTIF